MPLVTGEAFFEEVLHALLYAPFDKSDEGKAIQPILLYPDTSEDGRIEKSPAFIPPSTDATIQLRLIVLDGTWRKSREMLYLNRLLQQLPRLPLSDLPASHYRIRKAHKPDQLSTFEASCYALIQLEKNSEKYQPLLQAFDSFVEQMASQSEKLREAKAVAPTST